MAGSKPQMGNSFSHTTQNLLHSYNKRLQDDVNAMFENFNKIIQSAKIEESSQVDRATQNLYDIYQMRVRAANIVRAGESLLKLISELKTFVILNDFPSVNQHVAEQNAILTNQYLKNKSKFVKLGDEFSAALYDLESEHYSSIRPF